MDFNLLLTKVSILQQSIVLVDTVKQVVHTEFSVSRFIEEALNHVIEANASDIHFEPSAIELKIRYRKDGILVDLFSVPIGLANKVLAHLKSLAHLNVAENRKPQDGRMTLEIGGKPLNFRVSTIPVQFGESLVLRILDPCSMHFELKDLGLNDQLIEMIRKIARKPHGIFIVTGPTGSGKTTTLYSLLKDIYSPKKKYLTVEDPVEYLIPGVSQVSINNAIGLTFARVLRAFLRHDPDMIMVGEIRDLETAQIAVQASLTGHLVLTTLHTNSAASAVTRLIDLGLPPCLIASSLQGVLAQRLIRIFCEGCKGKGCAECKNTGFLGRTGIFELMPISHPLRHLISQNAPLSFIDTQAQADGMIKLADSGLRLVELGKASLKELNGIL